MPRISPLWTFIVTKAPGRPRGERASPAACTSGSIVSFRLSPGVGGFEIELPAGVGWPERVDLDPGQPRLAAQVAVVGVLDPALADLVARFEALVARLPSALLR